MTPFRVPAAAGVLCSAALLLATVLSTHAINTTTLTLPSSSSSCDPAMCGGLRIAYPFWLGGTHPPECGYRAFQVSCDGNGMASLKNSLWTYQIREINYGDDNGTFRITNAQLSDGTCDIERHVNASSDLGLAPFTISAANRQLFFLYNCTHLQARPPPPTWAHVNCANGSLNDSFALLAGGYKPEDKWAPVPGNCTVSMMPVRGYPGAAGKDYLRLMKDGFLLEYTVGDCAGCVDRGGLCRVNNVYDIFECHCPSGVTDDLCGDQIISPAEKGTMVSEAHNNRAEYDKSLHEARREIDLKVQKDRAEVDKKLKQERSYADRMIKEEREEFSRKMAKMRDGMTF